MKIIARCWMVRELWVVRSFGRVLSACIQTKGFQVFSCQDWRETHGLFKE